MPASDLRAMIGNRPEGRRQQQIFSGYVSTNKPAPTDFAGDVYVVIPAQGTEVSDRYSFAALNGATLPQQGDAVLVAFDETHTGRVIWWAGLYGDPTHLVPKPAPSAPSSGFELYVDEADGKLKTMAHSGTVTVLASP